MKSEEISRIENTLGVTLPSSYRAILESAHETGVDDLPEIYLPADELIALNRHFTLDPDDISDVRGNSFLDRVKFALFFRSPAKIIETRRSYKSEWAGGGRLVIGSDLSELTYFITLHDDPPRVYEFDLETARVALVADRLEDWVATVRAR